MTTEEVSPGIFANNPVSDFFRVQPGGFRNAALFWGSEHLVQSAAALGHSIKTGEASFIYVFGESFWNRMRRLPKENELFNRALADLRGDEHRQIADAYDSSGVRTVVDVGGGAGSLLAAILGANKKMRGILVEQPEVLPDAEHLLSERGVRDRCHLFSGSFFNPISARAKSGQSARFSTIGPTPIAAPSSRTAERQCAIRTGCLSWRCLLCPASLIPLSASLT